VFFLFLNAAKYTTTSPIALQPHPNTQKHQPTCSSCQSIHCGIPDSHPRQQHRKIRISISDTASRLFSSCGGVTNLLLRSQARKYIE
jgi:hypothetical protein